MPSRCRIPSEYARTGRPSMPPRPTRTSASSTRSARSRRPPPAASSSRRFVRPDNCGHAAGPSTSAPTRGSTCAASRGIGRPSSATRPAVGCTSPSSIRTSVVLPDPFGPSSPNRAPVGTVSDTPSTATTFRKRFVRPSVSMTVTRPPPGQLGDRLVQHRRVDRAEQQRPRPAPRAHRHRQQGGGDAGRATRRHLDGDPARGGGRVDGALGDVAAGGHEHERGQPGAVHADPGQRRARQRDPGPADERGRRRGRVSTFSAPATSTTSAVTAPAPGGASGRSSAGSAGRRPPRAAPSRAAAGPVRPATSTRRGKAVTRSAQMSTLPTWSAGRRVTRSPAIRGPRSAATAARRPGRSRPRQEAASKVGRQQSDAARQPGGGDAEHRVSSLASKSHRNSDGPTR